MSRIVTATLAVVPLFLACSSTDIGVGSGSGGADQGGASSSGGDSSSGASSAGGDGSSSTGGTSSGGGNAESGGASTTGGNNSSGGTGGSDGIGGTGGSDSTGGTGGSEGTGTVTSSGYPTTCVAAADSEYHGQFGCEFWATQTYNPVYTDFSFGVVLSNPGAVAVTVDIVGPQATSLQETVAPGSTKEVLLPWVSALKGPEFSRTNTSDGRVKASVRANGGAFKLTSDFPVGVAQFSPLQNVRSDVVNCTGTNFGTSDCYAVTADGTTLIPKEQLTGAAFVLTRSGTEGGAWGDTAGGVAITATEDGTTLKVQLPESCGSETWSPPALGNCVAAGTGVTAAVGGIVQTYTLQSGDVVQLLGEVGAGSDLKHADLSGTVLVADKPIQAIAFNPLSAVPDSTVGNLDHLEMALPPAETFGKSYSVYAPTSPSGAVKGGHVVRLLGLSETTSLSYSVDVGGPSALDPGQVVELAITTEDFQVTGDHEFAVASFLLGGALQGSGSCPSYPCNGDPAMTMIAPDENLGACGFVAIPTTYSRHDVELAIAMSTNTLLVNGVQVVATPSTSGNFSHALYRVTLAPGLHEVTTDSNFLSVRVNGSAVAQSWTDMGQRLFKHLMSTPLINEP